MRILKKIKDLIISDVSASNESNRITQIIRIQAILMILYQLLLCYPYISLWNWQSLLTGLSFLSGYFIIFIMTYKECLWAAKFTIVLVYIVQGISNCIIWGAESEGQYFIILSMIMCFLTFYMNAKEKIISAIAYIAIYIILNRALIHSGYANELTENILTYIEVVSEIIFFLSCSSAIVHFGNNTLESEKNLIEFNREILEKASVDPLTKLFNRRAADGYLEEMVNNYVNFGEIFSMAIGDIDFFKKVNDTYGHSIGDLVLSETAKILKDEIGKEGVVARWGGEEFLLVFANTNGDDAFNKLEKIRYLIQEHFFESDMQAFKITMTFGLTEYCANDSIEVNINVADKRLYYGKSHGRNCVIY